MNNDKIIELFREYFGDRADKLKGDYFPAYANDLITKSLIQDHPELNNDQIVQVDDIGFNLIDWQRNAAFLIALVLFPEKLEAEDIDEEIRNFFIHVPHHMKAAFKAYKKYEKLIINT